MKGEGLAGVAGIERLEIHARGEQIEGAGLHVGHELAGGGVCIGTQVIGGERATLVDGLGEEAHVRGTHTGGKHGGFFKPVQQVGTHEDGVGPGDATQLLGIERDEVVEHVFG